MRDIDKIQRQVHFVYAQPHDTEESDNNNTWVYNRAPSGFKFLLHSVEISVSCQGTLNNGIFNLYDGHEFTRWNIYPGVESRELLTRVETNVQQPNHLSPLNNWECKEYTIAVRGTHETYALKMVIIVWYYLQKMSQLETYYYAVIQPKWKRFKKAFRKTVEPSEEEP
ncbi:unnamed protein product [marine sediment metagenome]|uniref:Uncharacterized protein n=1 Tax=marine sediment metagenome TaxID=412755 RepID=X0ZL73_9ZZZZ